jgi:putative transposase
LLIEPNDKQLPIESQCELLSLPRSTYYYKPVSVSPLNLFLMTMIDYQHTTDVVPFGYRRLVQYFLDKFSMNVNHKHIQRLMREMGIEGASERKNLSKPHPDHKIYPYLLRGVEIKHVNQVWSTDITFIPMNEGFCYLVAIIDWYSRYVLSWELSNTLDNEFCIIALNKALKNYKKPLIFNTDQGSQFTANNFISILINSNINISMDGKGRAFDNIFIERLWRTVKYECIYRNSYATMHELHMGLQRFFSFYNRSRYHQSLNNKTPHQVYFSA